LIGVVLSNHLCDLPFLVLLRCLVIQLVGFAEWKPDDRIAAMAIEPPSEMERPQRTPTAI